VRGRKFREWLRYQYFEKMESGCNAEAMQVAVETIAAKAQYQGDERQGGAIPGHKSTHNQHQRTGCFRPPNDGVRLIETVDTACALI
jgi:hypothetical protein